MIQKVLSIPMNLSGAVDEAMFKSRLYTNKPVLVQVHRRDPYKQKHPRNARTGPAHGPVRALDGILFQLFVYLCDAPLFLD